jgi:Kef-type K+ transport system membrane component KefB
MDDFVILRNLGYLFLASGMVAVVGKLLKVPLIVSHILAGLLIGPVLGLVELDHSLELIAELGIALLLFLVGLELSFKKIRDVGKVALVAGLGQVLFTAVGGFVLCLLLGFSTMEAVFLATGLTFSSTVVVVKLLDQLGELNHLYGRIAVGIFLVQDLVVIFVLTFLTGFAGGETLDLRSIALGVGTAFAGMLLLCAGALLTSHFLLPRPFAWAARNPEVVFLWALSWCFLVVLGAKGLGLSLEIGAFLAGIGLAQMPYNEDLRRRVHPLMNFFVAIFFLTLGVKMEFAAAQEAWFEALVLSLFVLIGNPVIFLIIITRMGYTLKVAFKTSVTVAQISEFSFIMAAMGVSVGLVGSNVLSITAVVGILTMVVSAYMILQSEALFRFLERYGLLKVFERDQNASSKPEEEHHEELSGHILVIGMNPLGRRLVKGLTDFGETVLAVDTDPGKLQDLPCKTLLGNIEYDSVLEEAGFVRARAVVSALQIEDANQLLAFRCRQAKIPCAIHAFDPSVIEDLVDLEVGFLMVPKVDGILACRNSLKEVLTR